MIYKEADVENKIKLNTRFLVLDALKGFAILTVVYLHVHNGYKYEKMFDGEIVKWITSFHMALFFATLVLL